MTDLPVVFKIQMYLLANVKARDLDRLIYYVKAKRPSAYGSLTKEQVKRDAGELVGLMKKKSHISDTDNDYTFLIECLNAAQLGEAANHVQKLVDDKKAEQTAHHSGVDKAASFCPSRGLTLKYGTTDLRADRDSKQNEDFEQLLRQIIRVCNSCPGIKMPLLMVAPEDPCKLLAQGSGISKVETALEDLCKDSKFTILVADVAPGCITSEGLPIYTMPLGLGLGLGSWPIYKLEAGLMTGMGSTGLFVEDGNSRLFSVTASHVFHPEIITEDQKDNTELMRLSEKLTGALGNGKSLEMYTKTQNEHALRAKGHILVSFNYYASENIGSHNLQIKNLLTDIGLMELQPGAIQPWLTQEEHARGCPLELQYSCHPLDGTCDEGVIVDILRITSQSQIDALAENLVHIFIRGRGDLRGVILKPPIWLKPGEMTMAHSIFFRLSSDLMPGASGSAVMVRHKDNRKFYIIGILHGLWQTPIAHSYIEIYVATSLGASLDRLQHIYGDLNPGIAGRLKLVCRDHTVSGEEGFVTVEDLSRDPS